MSLFLSGGRSPTGGVLPRYPATLYIYNKVKTTNADIKRYKEQVMTRGKKKDDDRPEKYGKSGGDTKSGKSGGDDIFCNISSHVCATSVDLSRILS